MAKKEIEQMRAEQRKIQQQIEEAQAQEAELAEKIKAAERREQELYYIAAAEAFEREWKKLKVEEFPMTKANMKKLAVFAKELEFTRYLSKASKRQAPKKDVKTGAATGKGRPAKGQDRPPVQEQPRRERTQEVAGNNTAQQHGGYATPASMGSGQQQTPAGNMAGQGAASRPYVQE